MFHVKHKEVKMATLFDSVKSVSVEGQISTIEQQIVALEYLDTKAGTDHTDVIAEMRKQIAELKKV